MTISNLSNFSSNGVIRRDHDEAVAASPIRRDHGKATGSSVLKEVEDLKHSIDRLKVCLMLIILIAPPIHIGCYFQTDLQFLHGPSLLEPCNSNNENNG